MTSTRPRRCPTLKRSPFSPLLLSLATVAPQQVAQGLIHPSIHLMLHSSFTFAFTFTRTCHLLIFLLHFPPPSSRTSAVLSLSLPPALHRVSLLCTHAPDRGKKKRKRKAGHVGMRVLLQIRCRLHNNGPR